MVCSVCVHDVLCWILFSFFARFPAAARTWQNMRFRAKVGAGMGLKPLLTQIRTSKQASALFYCGVQRRVDGELPHREVSPTR